MLVYTALPTKKPKRAKKVVKERAPRKVFREMKPKPLGVYRAAGTEHIPSHGLDKIPPKVEKPIWYYDEMADREIAAQEIIERRAHQVRNAFRNGKVSACFISGE